MCGELMTFLFRKYSIEYFWDDISISISLINKSVKYSLEIINSDSKYYSWCKIIEEYFKKKDIEYHIERKNAFIDIKYKNNIALNIKLSIARELKVREIKNKMNKNIFYSVMKYKINTHNIPTKKVTFMIEDDKSNKILEKIM